MLDYYILQTKGLIMSTGLWVISLHTHPVFKHIFKMCLFVLRCVNQYCKEDTETAADFCFVYRGL